GYLVQSTGSFCSADRAQEVQTFFTTHPVAAAQEAMKRATNSIHDCSILRATQKPKLTEWLANQKIFKGGM
ncbi:MAG: hypothetical protein WBD91_14410, partial [Acidobacteriaceae bacterium]